MLFFESRGGRLFPVADIESITPSRLFRVSEGEERPSSVVLLKDETRIEVYDATVDELRNAGRGVIPALPSTYLLGYWPEPGQETYIAKDPVLAWKLTADGVEPVTTDCMLEEMSAMHAILHPDGTVSDFHGQAWASRADWEAEMKEKAEGG